VEVLEGVVRPAPGQEGGEGERPPVGRYVGVNEIKGLGV
jgi:hypothetical protein